MHNLNLKNIVDVANYLIFVKTHQKIFAKNIPIPIWSNVNKSFVLKIKKLVTKLTQGLSCIRIEKERYSRYYSNRITFNIIFNVLEYVNLYLYHPIKHSCVGHSWFHYEFIELVNKSKPFNDMVNKHGLKDVYINKYWQNIKFKCPIITSQENTDDFEILPLLSTTYEKDIINFCIMVKLYGDFLVEQSNKIITEKMKNIGKINTKTQKVKNKETIDDMAKSIIDIDQIMTQLNENQPRSIGLISATPVVASNNIQELYDNIHRRRTNG